MPGEVAPNPTNAPQQTTLNPARWPETSAAVSPLETTLSALYTDLERARSEYALRRYREVERLLDDIQSRLTVSADSRSTGDSGPSHQRPEFGLVEASLETLRGRLWSRRDVARALESFSRAVVLFDKHEHAIETQPSATRLYTDYGIALYRVGWRTGERIDQTIELLERVCMSGAAPPDAFGYLGYAELSLDNRRAAERWLRKGLELAPTDPTMVYWLARVLETLHHPEAANAYCNAADAAWNVNDYASAARCATRALRVNPSSERALALATLANLSRNRVALARALVERFLTIEPDSAQAIALKGLTLAGDAPDAAIALWRQALAAAANLLWVRFELARALLAKGSEAASEALAQVDAILQVVPQDPASLRIKAAAHMQLEQFTEALTALRDAAAAEETFDIRLELGRALLQTGDARRAVEEFERAIRLDPKNPAGHRALADCFRSLGDRDHAVSSYRRAARLAPEDPDTFQAMMEILNELGRPDDASEEIDERISGPLRPLALEWKARFSAADNPAAAIQALEQASTIEPTDAAVDRVPILIQLGNLRREIGRYSDAGHAYRDAVALDDTNLDAWWAFASYQCDIARFDVALEAMNTALKMKPRSPNTWGVIAWCHQHLGNQDEALDAFQKAFDYSEQHAYYEKGLANALYQMGRGDQSVAHFESVLKKLKYGTSSDSGGEYVVRDSNVLALLGWCNYRLGRFDEAIRLFQNALASGSHEHRFLLFDLTLTLLASGRESLATRALHAACDAADAEELERRRGLYFIALFDLIDAHVHHVVAEGAREIIITVRDRLARTDIDLTQLKWLPPEWRATADRLGA
jgi:tetratricopeptide (TPR) repeat protein